MGNIRILTDIVASQVAAGEVVERPASIVKELVENSLDAHSNRIEIEFSQSGTALIRVSDDGIGMDREDALLCLERHATSKLRTGRDLESLSTFGFRGEAIPSIASVSKFRMVTRCREAEAGTELIVNGGRIEAVRESGEAYGTRVEVRSLFFNVPARKKFLRGLQTEAGHIVHQLHCLALANPNVAFVAVREGRPFLQLPSAKDLEIRVRDLFGEDWMAHLRQGEPVKVGEIQVRGFLSQPGRGRTDRSEQFIFVNGRSVVSPAVSVPLRETYHSILPKGYHPGAILFLEMDPAFVDCNVHPAKREVRFREANVVAEAIRAFAQGVLEGTRRTIVAPAEWAASLEVDPSRALEPCTAFEAGAVEACAVSLPEVARSQPANHVQQMPKADSLPRAISRKAASPSLKTPEPEGQKDYESIPILPEQMEIQNLLELRDLVVVGKVATRFAILEGSFGMVVADLRAARERILFERLLNEMKQGHADSQTLLFPVIFDLPPRDAAWIAENIELLQRVGISAECFGGASIKVEAVPPSVDKMDIQQFLVRLIDDLLSGGIRSGQRVAEEALARSVARLAGGESLPTDLERIETLLMELLRCELPYSCPMGKATMIPIPLSELKRRFGWSG